MTPIIFVTAFRSDEMMQADHYAEGAVDFIFLPVQPAALRAKVSVFANLFIRARDLADQASESQAIIARLLLLLDGVPVGIFQTDAANRYVYTNARWSEITGIPPEHALGRDWDSIIEPGQSVVCSGDGTSPAVDGEFVRRFELRADGMPSRTVVLTAVCIRDSDAVSGWVGTLADVPVVGRGEQRRNA